MPPERVLTLRQPYAAAVMSGVKKIETRSWRTTYRGRIWVHAGLNLTWLTRAGHWPFEGVDVMHHGAIIGSVEIVDVLPVEDCLLTTRERALGDYSAGRFGWILRDPRSCAPRAIGGHLGLWRLSVPNRSLFDAA